MPRFPLLVLVALAACNDPPAPTKEPAAQAATAAAAQPGSTAAPLAECPGHAKGSCGAEAAEAHHSCGGESPPAAADAQHFGNPFRLAATEPLSGAAGRNEKRVVQVKGTVDAVCQKKGCWMVLKDGDVTARVFTHAGNFFLPIGTSRGRGAVVEGELEARTVKEEFARHLEEDKGGDPSKVKGDQQELVIQATSVKLL
jgi:hypothetical protein